MKKSYIINLKFGTWQNQIWLSSDEENINSFSETKAGLNAVSQDCNNSNDFFDKASRHFAKFGFSRIYK